MISQYTRYSCSLDCLSSYLRELGFPIHTSDFLWHHRDLLLDSVDFDKTHEFGSLSDYHFDLLIKRYSLITSLIDINDISDISAIIGNSEALFLTASNFKQQGVKHTVRIIGVADDKCDIISPGFPNGSTMNEHLTVILKDWGEITWRQVKPWI